MKMLRRRELKLCVTCSGGFEKSARSSERA